MNLLYIDPRTLPVKLSTELLQVGGIGIAFIIIIWLILPRADKKTPTVVPMDNGNMQTRTNYLVKKMQQCWDEDMLNTYLGQINQFEHEYHYSHNKGFYVKQLVNAFEKQQTNIYREQARADRMIRELQHSSGS